jgi:hypothetical protein
MQIKVRQILNQEEIDFPLTEIRKERFFNKIKNT